MSTQLCFQALQVLLEALPELSSAALEESRAPRVLAELPWGSCRAFVGLGSAFVGHPSQGAQELLLELFRAGGSV